MNRKLISARRQVEWLDMTRPAEDAREFGDWRRQRWEAGNRLDDLMRIEAEVPVIRARRAARWMDIALAAVALTVMAFSLGNIHGFALAHGVTDPIAWLLAPAVDIALVAALFGDAVLSRYQLDAGVWAARLRWFAGVATLGLNSWHAWAVMDPASIVLHTVPPALLILLAEAAPQYRIRFARTVELAAESGPIGAPESARESAPESVPAVDESTPIDTAESTPIDPPAPAAESAPVDVPESPARSVSDLGESTPAPTAKSARPRARTGRVPAAAKSTAPRRSDDELMAEARELTADWADDRITAESIRTALRVGPPRARSIRDALLADRAAPIPGQTEIDVPSAPVVRLVHPHRDLEIEKTDALPATAGAER